MVGGGHVSPPWAHPRGSESRRGDGPRASRRSAGAGRGLPWVNGPHGDVGPFLLPEGKPRPTKATVSSGISEPIVEWSFVVTRPRPRPEGLPRRVHGQSLPTQLTYTSDASGLQTRLSSAPGRGQSWPLRRRAGLGSARSLVESSEVVSLVAQMVKHLPATQETQDGSPD